LPGILWDAGHRYKSLAGFSIYAYGVRYVLRTRYAQRGENGIYIISNLPQVNISILSSEKNIELRSNISTSRLPTGQPFSFTQDYYFENFSVRRRLRNKNRDDIMKKSKHKERFL